MPFTELEEVLKNLDFSGGQKPKEPVQTEIDASGLLKALNQFSQGGGVVDQPLPFGQSPLGVEKPEPTLSTRRPERDLTQQEELIQDIEKRLASGGDVSVLERIAYYGSMPMRWLMDTKPGKWLDRASLSGVRTIFHDPTYGEETKDTTGSPTADKLADVLGSMAGAVWTMGQAGLAGGGASSLITSLGITNPVLRSVVSGVGTAATMHGLHTLSAPEEYRPKVKDFLKRATWLSSAGALTPGMQNIYDRFAGQTGFNKVLFHPVVRAGLVGIPVGGAGSALSQAVTGFEDTDSLSDFLKKTSKDALTYGGFKAISELPGTVMGRDKARAVDIYNRALDAKQRYIRGVNVIDDDTIDPNPEQIKKAVLDYGRATVEAYPIYMRRAPAGTKLTPEEHLRNNLVADISPLAHDIPADLTGESSVKWLGDALWSRASHTNFMAEEPPSPDMLALPFYEHEPAVESPVAVSSEITKSVTLGEKLISTLKVYEEAKDAQDKEQALILFAGIGQELKAIMNRMRDTAGEESWGPFLVSMEKLGVSPEQMGDILQKHEELIHEIEKHEKVYSHEDLPQELRQQSQERPVVEGEDTQPKFYTREDLIRQLQMKSDESEPGEVVEEKLAPLKEDNIEQYNQSLRSLWGAAREKGLTDEETRVFFTLHTQKDSMQDAVASDFKRVIDLLNSPKVDAKSVAQSYLKTRKEETAAEDDEVPKVEEAVSKDGLITPEDPDNIPPGTMISDIHGGDFEVVEENPNNYLVKDTKGNQRRIPKTMIRFKDSEPDMGEGAEVSEPPKTQPPSSGEPIALGMEEPEGDAEETEEVGPTLPEEIEETSDNLQFLAKYGKAYEKAIDLGYKLDKMSVVDPSTGNVLFRPEEHLKIQKFHDGREFEVVDVDRQLEGLMDFLDNETQVHSIGEATTTEIEIEEPVALGTEKTKTDTPETKEDTIDIAEEPSGESRPPKKTSLKPGFKKVGMKAGSQPTAILYNPETRERLEIILSDSEYSHNEFLKWFTSYTPEVLEQVRRMPIDEDSVEAMRVHSGSILKKGDEVIVVDGQTLPIGTKAKVVDVWEHRIKGARSDVEYVTLDNGKKIKALNLKIVGSDGAKRALADKGFDEYGNPLRGEGQEGLVVPTDIDSLKRGDTVFDPHGKEFNIVRVNKLSFRVKDTAGKETTIAKTVARVKTEEPVETEEPLEIVSDTVLEAEPETKVGTSDSQIVIRVGDRGRAVRDVAENKVQLFLNDDNDLWKHQSYQSYKLEFNQETGAWERELSDEAEETVKSLTGGFRWDDDESIGQIDRDYLIEQTRKAIADNRSAIETTWLGRLILPGTSARYARDVGKMYVMMLDGQITQEEYDEFIADTKKSFGIETEEVEPVEEATTTEIEIEEPAEAVGVEEPEVITPSERPQIITKNRAEATTEELAADYKARGLDHSEAWNQLVRDRNMNPQINNREFQEIYRTVSPEPFRDASIAGDTTPTHRLVETIGREKNVAIIEDNEHYVLWVDDTGGTGSTPRTMIKSLEPLTETEPGQSLQEWAEEQAIGENAETVINYLLDENISRVVKSIEDGDVTKSVALEIYDKVSDELGYSEERKKVERERLNSAKELVQMGERATVEPTGKESVVHTPKNYSVETRFEVVSLDDLLTSDQEGYPKELQPRERERVASVSQIHEIKQKLNPDLLGHNPQAAHGSPIVNKQLVNETGNGRTIALRELAEEGAEQYERYKEWMIENAEEFGIDVDKITSIEKPILVRIRTSEVDDPIEFARDANIRETLEMSVVEQAQVDSKKLTHDIMRLFVPHESGRIDGPGNRRFVQAIFEHVIGTSERAAYITEDGRLNVDGHRRIQAAILAKAYGDNSDLLTSMLEEMDDNVRRISVGLLTTSSRFAELKDGMERGEYHKLDITYEIARAANKLSDLRAQGTPVTDYLEQTQLPGMEDLSPLERLILSKFDEFGGRRGSQKKVITFLSNYAELVEAAGNPQQIQIPGLEQEPPTKVELLEAASSPRAMGVGSDQLDLFSTEEVESVEIQEHAEGRPEEGEGLREPLSTPTVETEIEETFGEIVDKYNLQDIAQTAEADRLAMFFNALDDLQEYDEGFGEELATEIQKLFSDTADESLFHDKPLEEISAWVNRYVRLVDKITEEGRDISPAEAKEATTRESKIDLQFFASKKGRGIDDWKAAIARAQSARSAAATERDVEEGLSRTDDAKAAGAEIPRTLEAPADDSEKEERPPAQVFIQRQKQPEGLEGAELEDWERQENERMRKERDSRFVVRDTWDGELKAVYKDEAVAEINKKIQKSHGTAKHVMQQLKEMDSEIASPKPSLAKKFLDHGSLSAELLIDIIQGASEGPVRKYLFEEIDMGVNQKYHVERLFKEGLTDIVQKVGPKTLRTWSKFLSKKGKDAIPIKIPLSDGKSISLTRDERMELYAHYQNEEWNRANLLDGGFCFYDNQGAIHKLSEDDIQTIISTITPQEKEIVDKVVLDLLIPLAQEFGNPVAQVLWGHNLTQHAWYFPILHPETTYEQDPGMTKQDDFTRALERLSFTQARTAKNKPLIIRGFFRSILTYGNQFSDFAGLAIPVHNAQGILADTEFVNQMYNSGFENELEVIENYVNDVAGNFRNYDMLEALGDRLLKNISLSYISMNIGTMLKQPISLVLAGTEIDVGTNIVKAMKNYKAGIKEAMEKSPKMWKRSLGYVTPEMGVLADSNEMIRVFEGKNKFSDVLTKGMRKTDLFAIGTIWNLTKDHVAKHYPELEGDEYYDKVIKVFDRVNNRSQPTTEAHTKSSIGRSKNYAVRGATLFSNQKNKNYNIVRRAWWEYSTSEKTMADKNKLLKALALVGIVTSGMSVAVDRLRDLITGKRAKKDAGETILDIVEYAAGAIYGGADVINIARSMAKKGAYRGYRFEDPVLETLNKGIRGGMGIYEAVGQLHRDEKYASGYKKDEDKWDTTLRRAVDDTLSVIAAVKGLPYDTTKRYAQGLTYHLGGEEALFEFDALTRNPQSTYYYDQLWNALEHGDEKRAKDAIKVLRSKFKVRWSDVTSSWESRGLSKTLRDKANRLF